MADSCQVLIASADSLNCSMFSEIAGQLGMKAKCCPSLSDARAEIDRQPFLTILCGDDLPDCNLRMAVRVLASATRGTPVVVISHLADWDACIKALDAGAFDYIACPPDPIDAMRILRLAMGLTPPAPRASRTAA